MIHIKYVIFMSLWPCTIRILISYRHRTRKFSQFFCKSTGGEDPFLPWSRVSLRSTSNFYALIGQNLTGEFMQKMYATSWKLFTLTAKADRVVMFLTVFFLWMDKMSCCYQESSVIHGWFVYWVFGWEMGRLSKFGNSISDDIVFVFHLAKCVRGFKILEQLWPSLIAFRTESRMVSLSNYCIWCLFLLYLISWSRAQFMRKVFARL